jgi:hypothetical protein
MYPEPNTNIYVVILMATSFGHNGRHQIISQKLKKAGTYGAKSSIYMGPHLHIH